MRRIINSTYISLDGVIQNPLFVLTHRVQS